MTDWLLALLIVPGSPSWWRRGVSDDTVPAGEQRWVHTKPWPPTEPVGEVRWHAPTSHRDADVAAFKHSMAAGPVPKPPPDKSWLRTEPPPRRRWWHRYTRRTR